MPGPALKTSSFDTPAEWPDLHSSLPEYEARFPGALGQWILKIQTDRLIEALSTGSISLKRGAYDVLDVGGGHGQVTPTLLELEKRVATVVSDVRATETLQKMLALLPPVCTANYTPIVASLNQLPLDSRSISQVISLRMVCHMPDWAGFIGELCRVSSSQVVVDYPSLQSANCFQHLFFKAKMKIEGNTRNFMVFDDREIGDVFRRHGFKTIRLYRQFALPLALHRAMKNQKLSELIEGAFSRLGLTDLIGSPVILSALR